MPSAKATPTSIKFQLVGVAELIEMQEMRVPIYQRSYRWRPDAEVSQYWSDLRHAFGETDEYFLGTVVLTTEGDSARKTIIDGQQRIVTTSLLLAAIRDHLESRGNEKFSVIERDYLAKETLQSEGKDPRLILNPEDDSIFASIVSGDADPKAADSKAPAVMKGYAFLSEAVGEVADSVGDEAEKRLLQWATFLRERVRLGVIEVPSESDAYVIFETLNNRGADLTTADLLKNYIFGKAGSELDKVRDYWMRTLGALELSAADSKFTAFLRHYWSSRYGLTRERDLYAKIKEKVRTKSQASQFTIDLSRAAEKYSAITNPGHEFWTTLDHAGKADLQILARFNLAPNRALLLAAMDKFSAVELKKLLRAAVSWSVRGTVTETINSGTTEERYCDAAVAIRSGQVKTVKSVRERLGSTIPSDDQFKEAFAIMRVPKNATARYYLLALERYEAKTSEPELVPNEDGDKLNLEHVLPQNATQTDWPSFKTADERYNWAYRLGNMTLLPKGKNGKIGNKSFAVKAPILQSSALSLTATVGQHTQWTAGEIAARQKALAEKAVFAWPR
ncbi:DUF262 domain-containing protein [Streptomyces sp. VNUA24]|uniref:DUF262 domain-containing protein n=1 Tax=Streptomyces sp. VNUA24 TaxID=3031131 RepID=UPI0023B7FFB2|nr:DUF262 domain-containing protein [Streptomyces sp. VNUA24]WEH16931.1 DUF262 domain-containing protein [Streptomyces sp. VNUA24]